MPPDPTVRIPRVATVGEKGHEAVQRFLDRVPRGEELFLQVDLDQPGVIDSWRRRGGHVFLADVDGDVVGLLAIVPGLGWSQHVGDLRLVVDPKLRGQGIGAVLARRGLSAAVESGLAKVTVQILADQTAVERLFRGLGFVGEALLVDQVLDGQGDSHDVLVLAHKVEETWSSLEMIGVVET